VLLIADPARRAESGQDYGQKTILEAAPLRRTDG
jgi:hypothetical protein